MLDERKVRASIKEKMRQAYPNQIVEVTAPELSYILRGGDMAGIIAEVEAEIKGQGSPEQESPQPEEGLAAAAGYAEDSKAPPVPTFEQVVTPLMQYLANNHCPHHHIVVTATSAELFQGQKSFNSNEFIKD